jgi:hypothetical protein
MRRVERHAVSQTRAQSALETAVNITVGYVVAIIAQELIFPLFGVHIDMSQNMLMGAVFTVLSIIRSFCLRRAFNRYHAR